MWRQPIWFVSLQNVDDHQIISIYGHVQLHVILSSASGHGQYNFEWLCVKRNETSSHFLTTERIQKTLVMVHDHSSNFDGPYHSNLIPQH